MDKVIFMPEHTCWEWGGFIWKTGYGCFSFSHKKSMRASRMSWIIHYGQIPDGLLVCHKCDNPGCVRPEHLFLGTPKQNTYDMISKKRNYDIGSLYRGKMMSHCTKGHEFTVENTYVNKNTNQRICRICKTKWQQKMRSIKKEKKCKVKKSTS